MKQQQIFLIFLLVGLLGFVSQLWNKRMLYRQHPVVFVLTVIIMIAVSTFWYYKFFAG